MDLPHESLVTEVKGGNRSVFLRSGLCFLQVGVVQYGSSVVHEFSLGEYQTVEQVVDAAKSISQRGGEETRTALGINVARYEPDFNPVDNHAGLVTLTQTSLMYRSEAFRRGGRPGAQKVMIVITDGESHDSPQLLQAVTDSERDNVTMYAIAVSLTLSVHIWPTCTSNSQ